MNIVRLDKLDIFIFGYLKTLNREFDWDDFIIGKKVASYIDNKISLNNFKDIKEVLDKRGFLIYNSKETKSDYAIKELTIDLDNFSASKPMQDLLSIYGMRRSLSIATNTNIDKISDIACTCLLESMVKYYTMYSR